MKKIFFLIFLLSLISVSSGWYFDYIDLALIKKTILIFDINEIANLDVKSTVAILLAFYITIYVFWFFIFKVFRAKKPKFELPKILTKPTRLLSTTKIGELHELNQKEVFEKFKSLGYIDFIHDKYVLTELGKMKGGVVKKMKDTGVEYIAWPSYISIKKPSNLKDLPSGRYTSRSGHKVRSKSELAIADFLYLHKIKFAYERKLPVAEDLHCDFYLDEFDVYIEHWGMEEIEEYSKRKLIKLEIYKNYNIRLIETIEEDIEDIHNNLPRKLLKYGIKIK